MATKQEPKPNGCIDNERQVVMRIDGMRKARQRWFSQASSLSFRSS